MIIEKINSINKWNDELKYFSEYSPYMYYNFCDINKHFNWKSVWIKIISNNKKILIYFKYKKIFNCAFFWSPQTILGDLSLLNIKKIKDFLEQEIKIKYIYIRINLSNEKKEIYNNYMRINGWKSPFKKIISSYNTVIINSYLNDEELKIKISKNFFRTIKKSKNEFNKNLQIIYLKNLNLHKVQELYNDCKQVKNIDTSYLNKLNYLKEMCGENFLVGCIEKNNKIVSLRIIYIGKKISLDFVNLTNNVGRLNLSNYYITNELLKYIFKNNLTKKFDFSGIDQINNKDVANFKLGFSGKSFISNLGEYEYSNNLIMRLIINFILFFTK